MPISWNEIRHNAIKFSRDWAGVKSERAEAQTFWNEFFQVFGIKRRVVASFEEAVKKISGDYGRIDLVWPGILLVDGTAEDGSGEGYLPEPACVDIVPAYGLDSP